MARSPIPDLLPSRERVLRLLAKKPARARDLVQSGLSAATIFRAAADLRARKFVRGDEEGVLEATDRGRGWIRLRDTAAELEPQLPIPALELVPTLARRQAVGLALCGVAWRTSDHADRSLAGFGFLGGPNGGKTTLARAVTALAGGDPSADLVDVPAQRGCDLFVRRDARGAEVTRARFLTVPVVILDEDDKGEDRDVRRTIDQGYLHGTIRVNMGNETYAIPATPVTVRNPKAPAEAPLEERFGSHVSLLRRLVIFNADADPLAEDDLKDWLAELITVDAERPVKVPKVRNPTLACAGRFRQIMKLILRRPDHWKELDAHLLENLARGATGFFEGDEAAIRYVAWAWARVIATLGWLHPEWESLLRRMFENPIEEVVAPAVVVEPEPEQVRAAREYVALAVERLGANFVLARDLLTEALNAREVGADKLGAIATPVVAAFFKHHGRDAKRAIYLLGLDRLFETVGYSTEDAEGLVGLAVELNLRPKRAAYALELGAQMLARDFRLEHLAWFDSRFPRRPPQRRGASRR
ncbi:MAG: hypothetical protein KIT58_11890 [Planctomycetota bacterium]|nr:hypothetical protein [Planctomycetota bacterium]